MRLAVLESEQFSYHLPCNDFAARLCDEQLVYRVLFAGWDKSFCTASNVGDTSAQIHVCQAPISIFVEFVFSARLWI
jgi:hypothetical protein